MFSAEAESIEAYVYHCDAEKDRYYIRITFLGTGMYINSFSVMPSKYGEYWVQPPKRFKGAGYAAIVEFDKSYPTWNTIEQKALEAVKLYKIDTPTQPKKDNVISDIPDGEITLDDLPF